MPSISKLTIYHNVLRCRKVKFECIYPWGKSYSEQLTQFLDFHNIHWIEDPRTEGGDSFGYIISNDFHQLNQFRDQLVEVLDAENDAWELGAPDQVSEIITDWKHLEVWSHPEELRKLGIEMRLLWEHHDPPYIVEISLNSEG